MRGQAIHTAFKAQFGNMLQVSQFKYKIKLDDLYRIFEIFNKFMFSGKFNLNDIEILVLNNVVSTAKATTSFGRYLKPTAKFLIKVYASQTGDNFYQTCCVLAHEMIHLYDMQFGQLMKMMSVHREDSLSGFYVVNTTRKQYVSDDRYDAHGKYFHDWCERFSKYGFEVKERYQMSKDRKSIGRLKEDDEKHDFFEETDAAEETKSYKAVRAIFDSIIAPGKRLVYRSADQWFIEFP